MLNEKPYEQCAQYRRRDDESSRRRESRPEKPNHARRQIIRKRPIGVDNHWPPIRVGIRRQPVIDEHGRIQYVAFLVIELVDDPAPLHVVDNRIHATANGTAKQDEECPVADSLQVH
jgi:hypothetical protein